MYRSNLPSHILQVLVIGRYDPIVPPRIKHVLSVRMKRNVSPPFGPSIPHDEVSDGGSFRFRKSAASPKRLRTGVLRCPSPTPFVTEVPVQIYTGAESPASIFPPQSVGCVRIFVTVGVQHRDYVPIGVLYRLRFRFEIRHELVDCERHCGRRDPFSGVYSTVHPDGFVVGVAVGDFQEFDGPSLDGGADRGDCT